MLKVEDIEEKERFKVREGGKKRCEQNDEGYRLRRNKNK